MGAQPALKIMTKTTQKKLKKSARYQMKLHDRWGRLKTRCVYMLERYGHEAIRIRQSRSVIGEVYNHSRMTEALMTHRFLDPIIVDLEWLADRCEHKTFLNQSTEVLFAQCKRRAVAWDKVRKPVRHRVWRG